MILRYATNLKLAKELYDVHVPIYRFTGKLS